ncbi:hypothetical protein ASC80_06320 [Afipia sp. Root123D2]|uniref:hypothetical protein n=1 Tax=Afipia sp. Root123D2 TaxID=1736436 RepID=UPI0006F5FE8B|nr:hypothetical protein [Afipia sp. Root123D2]KQW22939.1 hypothetical protein ASC80_06320 [Afipia sp. Root123D2]
MSSGSSAGAQLIFDASAGVAPMLLRQSLNKLSDFVPISWPDSNRARSTAAMLTMHRSLTRNQGSSDSSERHADFWPSFSQAGGSPIGDAVGVFRL